MNFVYQTQNTCAYQISFDINDGIVTNIQFYGGCNGNLKAISKLVNGMSADEIEAKLQGVTCGGKSTSCSDQLARAVREAANQEQREKEAAALPAPENADAPNVLDSAVQDSAAGSDQGSSDSGIGSFTWNIDLF